MRSAGPLVLLAFLSGCEYAAWRGARAAENKPDAGAAVAAYRGFAARHPRAGRAPEALVRAGEIAASRLEDCAQARSLFEEVLRREPGATAEPLRTRAAAGLMACPDFFPLTEGRRWVYGDSETAGANLRQEVSVVASSGAAWGRLATALFAGDAEVSRRTQDYERREWTVWRLAPEGRFPLLRYPHTPGMSWTFKGADGELSLSIEASGVAVRTAAGEFAGCLKVREFDPRLPGAWKFDYYAPGVGRVKTTVAGPGFENPNTELIKFDKMARRP